ncbi:MAG: AAA family ATPase, partial [Gemmataceae bacterium]
MLTRELAAARDRLSVVDVVAEPGMGKFRLLHEFHRYIDPKATFILHGGCSPDGQNTSFLPFIEVVRLSFQLRIGEHEPDIAKKLATGLTRLNLDSIQNRALLLNLFGLKVPDASLAGLDGVKIGLRTRELLQDLVKARCRMSPVVMLIEDIHWIDSASEELLGRFIRGGGAVPLLIVHTRRPE